MKRSRTFLILILILLVVNAVFFTIWHGFGGKNAVKGYIEKIAGNALGGELKIHSFNIGDRQVYAERISFASADSSLSFKVQNLRVRFDLFKLIFSGFRIKHLLGDVEINSPTVNLKIRPSEKKTGKAFEMPDVGKYFKRISVHQGRLNLDIGVALVLGEGKLLLIKESLSDIDISATSDHDIRLRLHAASQSGGIIKAEGTLVKDRLDDLNIQVSSFTPSFIHHPELGNPVAEINLDINARQSSKDKTLELNGKALVWNAKARLFDTWDVSLPFVSADLDANTLKVSLSTSSIGDSRLGGQIAIKNLFTRPSLASSAINTRLDLSMLDSSLFGIVNANLTAEGSFSKPKAMFTASSDQIRVAGQQISAIDVTGSYAQNLVSFESLSAQWMEHHIRAKGSFDPFALDLMANLQTQPVGSTQDLALNLDTDLKLALYESLPELQASIHRLDLRKGGISVKDIKGYIKLFPAMDHLHSSYFIDSELASADGQYLNVVGDILDRSLALSAKINTLSLAEVYPHELIYRFAPQISGSIDGFIHKDSIIAKTDLFLKLKGDLAFEGGISATGSYNINTGDLAAFLDTRNARLNGTDLMLDLAASMRNNVINVASFRLNDMVNLSGSVPLNDPLSGNLRINLNDVSTQAVTQFFPDLELGIPEIKNINLVGSYNLDAPGMVSAVLNAGPLYLEGIRPVSAILSLRGPPSEVLLEGKAHSGGKEIGLLSGVLNLDQGLCVDINAHVNDIAIAEVVDELPLETALTGELRFAYGTPDSRLPGINLGAKVTSPKMIIPDLLELQDLRLEATQTPTLLTIDQLSASSQGIAQVSGSGSLDYNLITNSFFEGAHRLKVNAQGELFEWLKRNVGMVLESSGRSSLSCEIGTSEEQFVIMNGNLDIRDGYLLLKDQVEPLRAINLAASIDNNRVSLDRGSFVMGKGRAKIFNEFEDDNSNHFFVGFLDLGIFKLAIEEPGILANIPFFTAPRTLSKVVVKGRDNPYLSVLGPFDDMKIKGDAFVSDAQALFPPNTDNLLNLVYSFRDVLSKPDTELPAAQAAPLPFSLDLIIHAKENIRYVTYPVKMDIQPGGILHLIYDGQDWSAKEANFTSEQGQIDFLGTIFQAEAFQINILESQDLFVVDGTFTKRSADGTIITLRVTTDRDSYKPLMERLDFKLSSDNPQDRSIGDILTKLRYSAPSGDLSGTGEQSFQDEALSLISDNLNTQLLSPMFYPLENQIRRFLKLDNFSINTGFIQNLFTQYSNDPDNIAQYMDTQHLMDDITRFSSTILLNNLSISASKYLGRRIYLDYQLGLQEATDLQKRTRILVSHDTSLKMFLPHQFKMGYTFKYEPQAAQFSHGVLLERSIRFWGI